MEITDKQSSNHKVYLFISKIETSNDKADLAILLSEEMSDLYFISTSGRDFPLAAQNHSREKREKHTHDVLI